MTKAAKEAAELLGQRVRELREKKRPEMSQERLAHASNLTTSAVSNVERGAKIPNLTTVLKIARGLKVNPAELFAGFTAEVMRKLKL
ncbi:MAG TPA: helix-turn-helix transcriptional regulator [Thermoanaerobaculia bacterium]|jgi:transcriptional regulator with XRE-family HTH domain|nr:helix-turn-helix transcriptional regulator [Thermoanaerobaculia bacterium]